MGHAGGVLEACNRGNGTSGQGGSLGPLQGHGRPGEGVVHGGVKRDVRGGQRGPRLPERSLQMAGGDLWEQQWQGDEASDITEGK